MVRRVESERLSLFGDVGLLISMGALNLQRTRSFFEAARQRDLAAVRQATLDYSALEELICAALNSGAHMDGAYDKLFVKAALPEFPLRLLPPYQGASDEEFAVFMDTLQTQQPHWLPAT